MADDQKLEVLEEEIKVLKGEVRRTLVDLRALVMRADSPLNEGGGGRRGAMSDLAPEDEIPATKRESAETVRQESTDPVISIPPPAAQPVAQPVPDAAPPGPPPGPPPGMPPQAQPGWPAAPMYQPPPPPMPAAGPPPGAPDPGAAEAMMRMADQERRLAEQDRKLTEQARRMAESDQSKSDERQRSSDKQTEQEKRIAQLEKNLTEASQAKADDSSQSSEEKFAQQERIAKLELSLAEAKKPDVPGTPPGTGWTPPTKEDSVEEEEEGEFTGSEETPDESDDDFGEDEDDTSEDDVEDIVPEPVSKKERGGEGRDDKERMIPKDQKAKDKDGENKKPIRRPRQEPDPEDELPESDMGSRSDHVEQEQEPNGYHSSGSSVFDEYFELMEIAESPQPSRLTASGAPLDLNLVASLVRWASIAKHKVGEERLAGILELYFQSRPISSSLRDLLNQIAEMADELPADADQTAQVCVDLISHLHGILTGGLPVGQVSQVVLPARR